MNYCSIDDAWKNSDSLTDQFKIKKKTIENFSENISDDFFNYDDFFYEEKNITPEEKNIKHEQKNTKLEETPLTKTNNYHNVFICDDFLDHLETCNICRMKMRKRFKSNIIEKFDNIIIDNKDTILLFLVILFALIFCNLLVNIFK
jgi:hypothetical protein